MVTSEPFPNQISVLGNNYIVYCAYPHDMQQVCEEILCIPNCSGRGGGIVSTVAITETSVTALVQYA